MKKHIILLLVLLIVPLLAHPAEGVTIGVNRAGIQFTDVLRGGFARASIVVTTDSDTPISGGVITGGEAAAWLNFSSEEFNFSRDKPYTLYIDISPPNDAEVKTYDINLSVITGELSRHTGGRLGTTTRASIGVPIKLIMTGTEHDTCKITGVRVLDTETGQPLQVELTLLNTGNVRLNPDVQVTIVDKFKAKNMAQGGFRFGQTVLPTLAVESTNFMTLSLLPDQYWANIEVPQCQYSGSYTFDILEPGGVKDDGEFTRIDAPSWSNVGDIIRIAAVFRNKGLRSVRASFKGTITDIDSGQIVKVIDTDQYLVDSGVTAELETFFYPEQSGRYMVTGKVYYNNKLTIERNFVLNVNGKGITSKIPGVTMTLIGVVIVILVLLILIRKRTSKHPHSFVRRR